ncbi:ANL_collapsed_G0021500.mRNA.1.CDS.1 [Saccharomyces cerevisiae]|nr:AVN_HP_G0011870.mRNA.1.CDS.1 [Saccharomyces cerevisiae]CAI5049487.1 AVN_HP_G0079790.mRNA.1.CDS.1 [Saccharomyces cerevisiae]CAI5122595.1 AVN_HP_G0104220.mRNA.1.CDS.1 [Saccharomyces cerevisiae]CAI6660654.1 AVN_HP_G0011870.mRNA.1.CDS.1 [Saccharomyces cerevisiae]CAI6684280.1 ANL_collapsed_G0021500.mRNA.1.CDS.1 [Saccharomyces cerevisiae]
MQCRSIVHRLYSKVSHVTTPIFYPNAKPHLGHLYSNLLSDVYHRWQLFKGNLSFFTTGTDEHGLKIQCASESNGFDQPKKFVDKLYPEFVQLDKIYGINYTRFIRTTDPDHIENVVKLWELCLKNGYIYMGEHKGWYSISDETFYPESKVIKDPKNDGKYLNTESKNEVVYQSETNYFFRLSLFNKKIVDHIRKNPDFIFPASKRDQILKELETGGTLPDLSISRPSARLKWGIPTPNDPSQKVYVWFDALCNYLSSIGGIPSILSNATEVVSRHYSDKSNLKGQLLIPYPKEVQRNTIHVIGKDIAKFHTVYWPSFLLAAGLPLPRQIVVHGHWLCNGMKMSKSLGNVVDPIDMARYYGADIVRWFLLENSKLEEDGDFQEAKLYETRELLVSKWGNLINRCCGSKFNIERAVMKFSDKANFQFQEIFQNEPIVSERIENLAKLLNKSQEVFDEKIAIFQYPQLLRHVWSIINDANTLVQNSKPWERELDQQDTIIFLAMETSRILSILCQSIIPSLSQSFLDRIDVSKEKRTINYARLGSDKTYGKQSNKKGREVPLKKIPFRLPEEQTNMRS